VPSGADRDALPDGPGDGAPGDDDGGAPGDDDGGAPGDDDGGAPGDDDGAVGDGAAVPTTGVGARPGYTGGGTGRTVERAGGSGAGRGAVAGSLPAGSEPAVGL
jgi:hypothetical protein